MQCPYRMLGRVLAAIYAISHMYGYNIIVDLSYLEFVLR